MTYALATVITYFDLLRSTISPEQLVAVAHEHRLCAVGIVDHATTLAHARLAAAAREASLHVVYGTTLVMEDDFSLRVLARNDDGYRSLARDDHRPARVCRGSSCGTRGSP